MNPQYGEIDESFYKESYERHSDWYNKLYPNDEDKRKQLRRNQLSPINNINNWLQGVFFKCIDPLLLEKNQKWLTVGDAYGYDANYILCSGVNEVIATDLNTDFLRISKQEEIIKQYDRQNAESLTYRDGEFDYVLCKESYHHFPRPYAALYEMIRVSKKAIVVIEPQDPVSKMSLLLWVVNILSMINPRYIQKIWKNRFSYEKVGNYVYKVSEREFEKFAAGLGLPMVAFKKTNPNFWFEGIDEYLAISKEKKFRQIQFKKNILDFLVKIGLISSQVLSTIVFKEKPTAKTIAAMKKDGYSFVNIPSNPYTQIVH